jgi:DNA topoisomerase-1
MTSLVIVESPAKCSKIQGFLGQNFRVIATMGHIRALEQDLDAVGIDRDFEPKYSFLKEKAKAIVQLKDAASKASKIYLAADNDREGAAIAYSVCQLLKLNPLTTPRAIFTEITKTAVVKAIENPIYLDMNVVHAAQARSVLDMLIGFTMSPLLWKSVGAGLSAGRCQTPALRLVADREQAIKSFSSSTSWKVHGSWSLKKKPDFVFEAHLDADLDDEESARNYMENHHLTDTDATILSNEVKNWSESAPLPLITSTLQQQSSTLFRTNPKLTMSSAQRLYEAGHITYMRTDKAVLCEEAVQAAKEFIGAKWGADYVSKQTVNEKPKGKGKSTRIKKSTTTTATTENTTTKSKDEPVKAQEAHEAIRPTHFETITLPFNEDWSAIDRKIYTIIWLRAVQSCMSDVRGEQRNLQFLADGDTETDGFVWKASWRRTLFEGWRKASTKETEVKEEKEESEGTKEEIDIDKAKKEWEHSGTLLPKKKLIWSTLEAEPHVTKAAQRYSEATLIRDLEQFGIGRPSTFANLISTIIDKKYVEIKSFESKVMESTHLMLSSHGQWPPTQTRNQQKVGGEKDRLTPTGLGLSVLNYLLKNFTDLFEYSFTAKMESRLDNVASGTEFWKNVVRDTWTSYKDTYTTLKTAKPDNSHNQSLINSSEGERRRELGEGYVAIMTKKGPLLLREFDNDKTKTEFYGWPGTSLINDISLETAKEFIEEEVKKRNGTVLGDYNDSPILLKKGPYGSYVAWKGFSIQYVDGDTVETISKKIEDKLQNSSAARIVGCFEIRKSQYGWYMFKPSLTGHLRKFVGIPETVQLDTVSEATLISLYQIGIQSKARSGTYAQVKRTSGTSGTSGTSNASGSFRGGGRGRGGARGGGRGGARGGRGRF